MIFVRADGNAKIGVGHLMRCLTIAEAYVEYCGSRSDVLFVCADEMSAEVAKKHGFAAKALGTDYLDMESELFLWRELVGESVKPAPTILVDSYYVTHKYLQALREYGRVILLDDMQQQTFAVDEIINYNIFADTFKYGELYQGTNTLLHLGARYVPVRKQFQQVEYEVAKDVRHILITTGGGDVDNIAGAILEKLCGQVCCISERMWAKNKVPEQDVKENAREITHYHLVLGQFNPHRQEMEQLVAECPNVHVHVNVEDMAGLMKGCDLAITAGGTTVYELAAIGIPFVCFSYAENQEALTSYVGEKQVACFAGAYHKAPEETLVRIKEMVEQLSGDFTLRQSCFEKERAMIDGEGARRLAEVLQGRQR